MPLLNERRTTVLQIRQWATRGRLFAIVDATDMPAVPFIARDVGEARAVSLYKGQAEESLFAIAPYLFHVDVPTLDWIAGDLWSQPWGMFVLADQPIDELRQHFRKFLIVQSPAGESWYFRFYDPRVLRAYLGSSTSDEATALFGPATAFAVTDAESYAVTILSLNALTAVSPRAQPRVVVQPSR